ncbi:MAG: hypothetical protein ACI4DN_06675 [Lachnospiraceae bacterium]
MKKQGRISLVIMLVMALTCTSLLTGCGSTEKGEQAARKAVGTAVVNEAGAVGDYNGIVGPTLEAVYTQTEEEAKKYDAEMKNIMENGLGADRELQSGI